MNNSIKNVLVVEDSDTMRNFIAFSLSKIDKVEITPSVHGVDALRQIKNKFFDLIVTDLNMPFMDGLKLIKCIKDKNEYRDVPIVIITTRGKNEDRERGLRLGANAYITKPIKTFQLLKIVKKLLNVSPMELRLSD